MEIPPPSARVSQNGFDRHLFGTYAFAFNPKISQFSGFSGGADDAQDTRISKRSYKRIIFQHMH